VVSIRRVLVTGVLTVVVLLSTVWAVVFVELLDVVITPLGIPIPILPDAWSFIILPVGFVGAALVPLIRHKSLQLWR
jgi:hypothetical protein